MSRYDEVYGRVNSVMRKLASEVVELRDEHEREVSLASKSHVLNPFDVDNISDENLLAWGLVRLPKDADGEPIHVGDVLTDGEYTFRVDELAAFGDGSWSICNEDGNAWAACDVTHHHAPTVEDVLREFAEGLGVPVADSYIAASAAKLRLAEGEEQ